MLAMQRFYGPSYLSLDMQTSNTQIAICNYHLNSQTQKLLSVPLCANKYVVDYNLQRDVLILINETNKIYWVFIRGIIV